MKMVIRFSYLWEDAIHYNEIVSSLDRLGENILYALKNFSTQWEDSILSVKIKGDFSN